MSVEPARMTVIYTNSVVDSDTEPENKTDGLYWRNSATNVLSAWRASTESWEVVADYNDMTSQLGTVKAVTVDSADFLGLLASAEYTAEGLLLKGVGGRFNVLLGTTQLTFYDGGEPVAYLSNSKLYIQSAELIGELKVGNYSLIPDDDGGLLIL